MEVAVGRPVRGVRPDVIISVALFLCALAVRWPNLMTLPAFSDESLEIRWAMDIARGVHWPLTAYDAYDGPLFPYLIAGAFKVFGFHLIVPRAVVMACGALTVPATFWLGRLVGGRSTGVLAAGLTTVCPTLVLYSSHYAWSNSLTPFFATISVALLYAGVERRSSGLLAAGGVIAGLTIQTHPLAALPFVGIAIWLVRAINVAAPQAATLKMWPAAGLVIGYVPMIVANVTRPLITLRLARQRTYAFLPTASPGVYAARLIDLGRTFVDMISGGLRFDRFPAPRFALVAFGGLLAWALLTDWRSGRRLFVWTLASAFILMPVVVTLFIPRYLALLLPLSFVMIARAVVNGFDAIRRIEPSTARLGGAALCAALMVVILAQPLWWTYRYTRWAEARGLSNGGYFALRDAVGERNACGSRLFVEEPGRPLVDPAWVGLYAADYVLSLSGCPHRLLTLDLIVGALADGQGGWVVSSAVATARWPPQWRVEAAFQFAAPAGTERLPLTLYRMGGMPGATNPAAPARLE